jgi:hypothetical protein
LGELIVHAVVEAQPQDAAAIAAIHLTARQKAMPYLRLAHTDDETRAYFAQVVADKPLAWWVVRHSKRGCRLYADRPRKPQPSLCGTQLAGLSFGSALRAKAKTLSPRLALWTFQRNSRARAFYETHGFRSIAQTDGENEEHEPDVQYEWRAAP